ncbi:Rod shape-determining protein MreC [Streptococcus sp. DD10]|nr:Rod shape-determining protein MreC [Streptococcus sp. DD10]
MVDSALSSPFFQASSFFNAVSESDKMISENQLLKNRIYQLKDLNDEISNLESENQQLKSLLNFQNSFSSSLKITSKVLNRNTIAWYDSLTISAESNDNFSDNMLVVANGGLIGFITSHTDQSAEVSLLTNETLTSNITVKVKTSSGDVFAVLTGFDKKNGAFILKELNREIDLTEDEQVVTSGLGDYPVSGIPVGRIQSIKAADNLLSTEVLVKPSASFDVIQYVMAIGE